MRPQPQGGEPVQIEDMTDVSLHARINSARASLKRRRRIIVSVAGTLLAIGAFVAWGPIGIGAGPVGSGTSSSSTDTPVPRTQPAVFVTSIDAGKSGAVIDSVSVFSDGSYPAPRVISIKGDRDEVCGGAWPLTGVENFYNTCDAGGPVPLIGRAVPVSSTVDVPTLGRLVYPGIGIAIETAPPGKAGCWLVTSVVIRYHIGIRHYTATHGMSLTACSSASRLNALRS
jgi:hypothetical protein